MAIQLRRGNYADLDPSKLVQGEPFVTLDNAGDGHPYVGVAQSPNQVVRLATYDELTDIKNDCENARDEAVASASSASTSESNSEAWAVGERGGVPVPSTDETYENNSKYYAEQCDDLWTLMDDAIDQVIPSITIDFTTGHLDISGSYFEWDIDTDGHLNWSIAV